MIWESYFKEFFEVASLIHSFTQQYKKGYIHLAIQNRWILLFCHRRNGSNRLTLNFSARWRYNGRCLYSSQCDWPYFFELKIYHTNFSKAFFRYFNSFLVKLNWVSRTFNCVGEWTSWSYFDRLEQKRFKCKIKISGHLAILICFVIDCFLSHFSLFKIQNTHFKI